MKRIIIIALSLVAFLCLYTIAFQLYFGPPSKPDLDFPLSERGQRESMQKVVERLEDDNAAKFYILACLEMRPIPSDAVYDNCDPKTDDGEFPTDTTAIEECIATREQVFGLVKEGIGKDRFFLPTRHPLDGSFDLSQFTSLAHLLEIKGRLHVHKREYKEAVETSLDQLRLSADIFNNSSIPIMGIVCEHGAYRVLESVLAHLDDEELLQSILKELIDLEEDRAPLRRQFELSREKMMKPFSDGAKSALYWGELPLDPGPGDYFLDAMYRTGQYLISLATIGGFERRTDEFYKALMEISEEPYPEVLRQPLGERIPTDILSGIVLPAIEKSFRSYAWQEATRRAHILKVALRLHKLRDGTYPESLDELSVALAEQILMDPLSTNRFIYNRTDDGYLFYSFGLDLDDDGAKPDKSRYDGNDDGDIVFKPPEAMEARARESSDSEPEAKEKQL